MKNVCGLRHLFVDFICLVGNGFEKFDLEKIFRMCISHAPKLMGRIQVSLEKKESHYVSLLCRPGWSYIHGDPPASLHPLRLMVLLYLAHTCTSISLYM